jgi:hypothetical protein
VGGRRPYRPTSEQRDDVRMFKADGWSDDRIASRLGISRPTLLKHFAQELEGGADEERQFALRKLREAADKLNVAAIKEYLKVTSIGGAVTSSSANRSARSGSGQRARRRSRSTPRCEPTKFRTGVMI